MPSTIQCKVIGAVSVLLGVGVLVASSIYLHESNDNKCHEYLHNFLDIFASGGFQHGSRGGGVHGGYGYGQSAYGDHYSNYDQGHGHYDDVDNGRDDKNMKLRYCIDVIHKYRTCAIIALVAACLQILISIVYAFSPKKIFKALSLAWIGTHFGIVIAMITTAAVVLAEKRLEPEKYRRQDEDDLPEKKLGFAIVALLDAFILLLLMVFAGLSAKNSNHDGYEPKDMPVKRKFLES